MKQYVLAKSFGKQNVQNRIWYAQTESDKDTMKADTSCNLLFGDRVYVIVAKKWYIFGADQNWYEMAI